MKKMKHWFVNAFKTYMRICESNAMLYCTGTIPMRFDENGKPVYGVMKAA